MDEKDFPDLIVSPRPRALREVGEDNIPKVLYYYLFLGYPHRRLDAEVLHFPESSRGFESMGLLHHFGLVDAHKGLFADVSIADAVRILQTQVAELDPYLNALYTIKSDHDRYTVTADQMGTSVKEASVREGAKRLQLHQERERNHKIIEQAKQQFLKEYGSLYCEVCGFDFASVYGLRGNGFIEGHHKTPIAQMKDGDTTSVDDIAMVCSNCHSMLHRQPFLSVAELRGLIKNAQK